MGEPITSHVPLVVFPTELAKRRHERNAVLKSGVLDTSRLFTMKILMDVCERAARRAGLLKGRTPGAAELRLLLDEAAGPVRFAPSQPLARLSGAARSDLLKQLIETFAFLAENEATIIEWLLAHETDHKLHGLGQLLEAWQSLCAKNGIADRFAVNAALLRLIDSGDLPNELTANVHFRAVRWFNPFEERLVAALKNCRLSIADCRSNKPQQSARQSTIINHQSKISVFSVLPGEHAPASEDRLCAVVRSELERGNEEEWQSWLEDFADAFEADDSNILEADSAEKVSFFVSAHPYGEIEDAARRIATEIESGTAPEEIALILRDLSPYTDIIPDVFQRFGIPYYFRRGTPAAAHPPVKALLALLAFPQNLSRDRLCDLLLMPGVKWPGVENREELVQEIRKTEPPRLFRLPKELSDFFQPLEGLSFAERTNTLIEQHDLDLPEEVLALIKEIGGVESTSERMLSLFEELLDNVTLKDDLSTESGVWIINPMDAAGLRFESVFIAGMDDRTFPQIPKADSLLNTTERKALRAFLDEREIDCPRLALSEAGEALIQEEILFLTAISAAKERLELSYTRTDADGKERAAGEFFERMVGLTQTEAPALGESFHTILPPDACRAKDEVRQTAAHLARENPPPASQTPPERGSLENSPPPEGCPQGGVGNIASTIQKWLKDHPEFSATALESLARNRYAFFLEKVLRIKPDRTHEDDTDPMDRGTLVHDILELVYTAIAEQSDLYATQSSASVPLALNDRDGRSTLSWRITQQKTEESIPLAVFDPAKADELLALAHEIADEEFAKAEQRPSRHLGHRAVWETEKRKLHQVIENFIRMDLKTALKENRYPALFEMKFDEKHDLPVTLTHTFNSLVGRASCIQEPVSPQHEYTPSRIREGRPTTQQEVRLKGKIDRIDLIFDDGGELERILVVDYKGKSRNDSVETLEKKIGLNLDCQLALYTFAAQQKFFGAHNTPELNEKVQAVYHLQNRVLKNMTNHFSKKRLTMNPELADAFLETLFSNVWKFSNGDLATEPLIAGYEDYSHICRAREIDPKELLK